MSTLSVACPYCQAKIKVPEKMIGRQINCPSCKQGLKLEGAPPAGGGGDPFAFSGGAQAPAPAGDFGAMTDAGASRPRSRPSAFWEFLTFRRMIAPIVLQILFWILIVLTIGSGGFTVIGGVIAMTATTSTTVKDDRFGGKGDPFGRDPFDMPSAGRSAGLLAGGLLVVTGLFQMIFGPLVIRIGFEMMMMVFRVYDVLREIRDKLDRH